MKLLITGICGFVGAHLARRWVEAGHQVIGIDNLIRPGAQLNRDALKGMGVKVLHGDIRMASDFEALPSVDHVIDAAANPSVLAGLDGKSRSRQVVEHNLLGTINILEYCRRVGAGFVLISTSRVYAIEPLAGLPLVVSNGAFRLDESKPLPPGVSAEGIAEDFSTRAPVSLYGATKLASEVMALEYGEAFGLSVRINRCGVLAGAGQFGHAEQGIFSFWLHSYCGRRPLRYINFGGHGHQVRDALHPEDLYRAIELQLRSSDSALPRVMNLAGGAGQSMSLLELTEWCERRWGRHTIGSDPGGRRYDVPWMVLDARLARDALGWRPTISLEAILGEIADHAESNPNWLDICLN